MYYNLHMGAHFSRNLAVVCCVGGVLESFCLINTKWLGLGLAWLRGLPSTVHGISLVELQRASGSLPVDTCIVVVSKRRLLHVRECK